MAPLRAWYDRVPAIGHGRPMEVPADSALDIARDATPRGVVGQAGGGLLEINCGTRVTVTPDDTDRDPVEGTLVAAGEQVVVIQRSHPRVGEVHVHFPRAGYDVAAR